MSECHGTTITRRPLTQSNIIKTASCVKRLSVAQSTSQTLIPRPIHTFERRRDCRLFGPVRSASRRQAVLSTAGCAGWRAAWRCQRICKPMECSCCTPGMHPPLIIICLKLPTNVFARLPSPSGVRPLHVKGLPVAGHHIELETCCFQSRPRTWVRRRDVGPPR